jgi:PAP2 superfamily protein
MAFSSMTAANHRAIKIGLTAVAVLAVGFLAISKSFYEDAMADPFFALELGSVFILLIRLRPKWSNVAAVAPLTLITGLVDFRFLHYEHHVMAWFSFLGLASFLVMLARLIWESDRRLLIYAGGAAFVFALSEYFASNFLSMTATAHPRTLDLYLLLFDTSLRTQPSFLLGQIYATQPWVHIPVLIAYIGLAVPIMMVYAGRLARFGAKALSCMVAFVVTGPVGLLFYNIFPAAGPHNLFGHKFPFSPLPYSKLVQVILEPVQILGERNAMPSLHLAWTLLAWWYSRGLSWIERTIAFFFLALTAFATMGTGEHWLADLVVAVPFSLMIQAVCAYSLPLSDRRRQTAFLFGLLATVGWLILLRYCTRLFWTSPLVPWSLIIATVALTSIRQGILDSTINPQRAVDVEPVTNAQHFRQHAVVEDQV